MDKIVTSSWNEWNPKSYLKEFYGSEVAPDEIETIAFLTKLAKKVGVSKKILDFGCGPTLHHIFPFIPHAAEVHVADFLPSNLDEISKFLKKEKGAHNWNKYIAYTLSCEGFDKPTKQIILKRRNQVLKKVTKLIQANAQDSNPMGLENRASYPVVISCFCADSATNNHDDFALYIRNIASLVKPGGTFAVACLRKTNYYKAKLSYFPSANVDEDFLYELLKLDFVPETITLEVKDLPHHKGQGYTGIILAYATKNNKK